MTMPIRMSTPIRLATAAVATTAIVAIAGPANAHVTVTPTTTTAGEYSVLTFSVGHGCEGSPTTKIAISVPEEILSVTPTRQPLWKVTKVKETLAEPVTDAHGNSVTERDASVVYSARTPLPDGYRDAFELSVQLPDAEGETLVFPTVQTCEKGETPWTEVAAEGQDPHQLEQPAPTVSITAGEAGGHDSGVTSHEAESEATQPEEAENATLGALGLGAGLLGLLAGGTALWQVRRRA